MGKAKVGLLVVLAILLRNQPQAMAELAEKLSTLPHLTAQGKLPLLVWACGQVASVDLILGMWLWVRTLLPLAVGPKTNPLARDLALTFFESVICKNLSKARSTLINGASKKGERVVPPAALVALMRAACPPEAAQTKVSRKCRRCRCRPCRFHVLWFPVLWFHVLWFHFLWFHVLWCHVGYGAVPCRVPVGEGCGAGGVLSDQVHETSRSAAPAAQPEGSWGRSVAPLTSHLSSRLNVGTRI